MKKYWFILVILSACGPEKKAETIDKVVPERRQVISLMGHPLPVKEFPDSTQKKLDTNIEKALKAYETFPDSIDLAIWYGRRVAYSGRYFEAIDVYSDAIEKFPDDHRLYRHRGHRYITTRQLDLALKDFTKATKLAETVPNAIEPDGLPNKLNIPLGNDRFNIYYHHGLTLYLQGRYKKAAKIYAKCMDVSDNNDLKVATTYWLFMTLHRLDQRTEAHKLLQEISEDMEIIENDVYHRLLLLFKNDTVVPGSIHTAASEPTINPTMMYGFGNYIMQISSANAAEEFWKEALTSPSWDAFGYIAAEAEISRK